MLLARQIARVALLVLAFAVVDRPAWAEEFPVHPVRIVVAFPPGGPNDVIARAVGQKMSELWKQPVVVENRPGASGIIGSEAVAHAAPDGYTLMMGSITHAILPGLYRNKLPFDAVGDFTAVAQVAVAPMLLVVHPSVPATSVKELIEYARANPGKLSYASTGNGTSIHLIGEMFKRMAGVDIVHVPYKGSAPAMTDLLGGHVQMMIEAMPSALPHVKEGRLRALAVTSTKRSAQMPDLPTVAEAALPGFEGGIWWGVLAPAGLPAPVLDALNATVNRALDTPEVRARFAALGVEAAPATPAAFDRLIRDDVVRFGKIIEQGGIHID